VGAVIIGVIAVVLVVSSLGGGSGKSAATSSASSTTRSDRTHTGGSSSTHPSESSTPAVGPAETQVAVLNGTSTNGLAHRLSATLQQSGYSQATPLDGVPPGTRQTTVVQYVSGHHAEAAQVARALGVSEAQVQPMEGSVSPLVGGSTVVVIAGLDKAGAGESTSSSTSSSSSSSSTSSSPSESAASPSESPSESSSP